MQGCVVCVGDSALAIFLFLSLSLPTLNHTKDIKRGKLGKTAGYFQGRQRAVAYFRHWGWSEDVGVRIFYTNHWQYYNGKLLGKCGKAISNPPTLWLHSSREERDTKQGIRGKTNAHGARQWDKFSPTLLLFSLPVYWTEFVSGPWVRHFLFQVNYYLSNALFPSIKGENESNSSAAMLVEVYISTFLWSPAAIITLYSICEKNTIFTKWLCVRKKGSNSRFWVAPKSSCAARSLSSQSRRPVKPNYGAELLWGNVANRTSGFDDALKRYFSPHFCRNSNEYAGVFGNEIFIRGGFLEFQFDVQIIWVTVCVGVYFCMKMRTRKARGGS